jgi:hypothetical protein
MKTVIYLFIIGICFYSCSSNKNSVTGNTKVVNENFLLKSMDTLTIEITTFCFQKQEICFDTITKKFVSRSEDILEVLENDILDTLVFKYDTLNILPVNMHFGKNDVVDQFFNLFNILVGIRNNVSNKDSNKNYFDSLEVKTSSFFDLNIETPLVVLDTMKYNYKYYEGERILEGTTNLFVELKIDRLEECNLNYLLIKNDTIRQNDFVIHRYKSMNDICEKFDFTLSFKTNEKNIIDWSNIFYLDDWILEHFEFPKENKK